MIVRTQKYRTRENRWIMKCTKCDVIVPDSNHDAVRGDSLGGVTHLGVYFERGGCDERVDSSDERGGCDAIRDGVVVISK